jgi:hypothetical protein
MSIKLSLQFGPEFADPAWAGKAFSFKVPVDEDDRPAATEWLLGRSSSAHVALSPSDISQRHAVIGYHPGSDAWSLTDVGSTNGTWLKAERWKESQKLHVGDPYPISPGAVFWLGTNRFVVAEDDYDTFPNNIWQSPTDHDEEEEGSETAILLGPVPHVPPPVTRTPPDVLPPPAPPPTDAQAVLAWVGKLPLWAQLAIIAIGSGLLALWLTR